MTADQYQVRCKNRLCDNIEVTENPDSWKCICQNPPKGVSTFHRCTNHNHRYWGGLNEECVKCKEDRANGIASNLNAINVEYETFGEGWPKKKSNLFEREALNREKQLERETRLIELQQKFKKAQYDNVFAINKIPGLLESLNAKLDKLIKLQESEGFHVTE